MNTELKEILDALMESRAIIEAKLEAMDSRLTDMDVRLANVEGKLDAVAADVTTIKGQLGEMNARDQFIIHKMGEVEGDVHVLKKLSNMKT
jgi:predicted  nucleic acid-binding Zn-ribbon protein